MVAADAELGVEVDLVRAPAEAGPAQEMLDLLLASSHKSVISERAPSREGRHLPGPATRSNRGGTRGTRDGAPPRIRPSRAKTTARSPPGAAPPIGTRPSLERGGEPRSSLVAVAPTRTAPRRPPPRSACSIAHPRGSPSTRPSPPRPTTRRAPRRRRPAPTANAALNTSPAAVVSTTADPRRRLVPSPCRRRSTAAPAAPSFATTRRGPRSSNARARADRLGRPRALPAPLTPVAVPGQRQQLGLVRRDVVHETEQRVGQRTRRRGIEQNRAACGARASSPPP